MIGELSNTIEATCHFSGRAPHQNNEKNGVATSEQSVKTIQFITRIMIKSIFTGDENPKP